MLVRNYRQRIRFTQFVFKSTIDFDNDVRVFKFTYEARARESFNGQGSVFSCVQLDFALEAGDVSVLYLHNVVDVYLVYLLVP